jgi:Domain of Unknown Function (DUF748)
MARSGNDIMRRRSVWIGGILLFVVAIAFVAARFLDAPLRRTVEQRVNQRLVGYTAHIGRLHFHPIGFSLALEDVTLTQDANPDPPVAHFRRIDASVQWRELLRARVVANFSFDRPTLYVNRAHLRTEAESDVPVDKRGWQDALEAIYPLKINELRIVGADVTYVDEEGARVTTKPLRITGLDIRASNIRNVKSGDRVYPSPIRAEGDVFDSGHVTIDGHADFLAEPSPAIRADVVLRHIELAAFQPILRRYHLSVTKGVLEATGHVESGPHVNLVQLTQVTVDDLDGQAIHVSNAVAPEKQVAAKAGRAADEATARPDLNLRIDRLSVHRATVGFVNKATKHAYRVFLSGAALDLTNLSNQPIEGTSEASLSGQFMGSGATTARATFRPETHGPDFTVSVKVENTDLRSLNDLFLAYGKFDVAGGLFAVYSEITAKDRFVRGYVKPIFENVDVYDPNQDAGKSKVEKLREHVVSGLAKILSNKRRSDVATVANIAGPLENPKASPWQTLAEVVENAFFKAILPGFEREVRGRG